MVPRNLRKPTPSRVRHYWRDLAQAWRFIGHAFWLQQMLSDEPTFAEPPKCDRCGRIVSKSAGCKDEPPTCSAER